MEEQEIDLNKLSAKELDSLAKENFDLDTTKIKSKVGKIAEIERVAMSFGTIEEEEEPEKVIPEPIEEPVVTVREAPQVDESGMGAERQTPVGYMPSHFEEPLDVPKELETKQVEEFNGAVIEKTQDRTFVKAKDGKVLATFSGISAYKAAKRWLETKI